MAHNDTYAARRKEILDEKQNLNGRITNFYEDLVHAANQQQPAANAAEQGQHVINKDILRLQRYIIDKFVERCLPQKEASIRNLPNSSLIQQARTSTNYFENEVGINITDTMKAHIPAGNYIDRNALVYKEFINLLRTAALEHMVHLHQNKSQGSPYLKVMQETYLKMNKNDIYVDQDALTDWLRKQGGNEGVYRKAKGCVEIMLTRLEVNIPIWVGELNRLP